MKIKKRQVKDFIKKIKLDMDKYKFTAYDLYDGAQIELEHGYISKLTNVTNDDVFITLKIALAHLLEFPDYYVRLKQLEKEADEYWKNRAKTNY